MTLKNTHTTTHDLISFPFLFLLHTNTKYIENTSLQVPGHVAHCRPLHSVLLYFINLLLLQQLLLLLLLLHKVIIMTQQSYLQNFEVFKITHNIYDEAVSPDLSFYARASTRGNNYKVVNHSFHYDLRKHFFLHVL